MTEQEMLIKLNSFKSEIISLKEQLKDISVSSEKVLKLENKIRDLTKRNITWENEYSKLSEKYSNLQIENRSLERRLNEYINKEDIDKILNGEITNKEIDEAIKEAEKPKEKIVVKTAERELQEMINGK